MTSILFLKLATAVVSVALAAGLLARDHELTANRLIAAFLLCNAFWATCEFYLFQTREPAFALEVFRWMTLGWMPMGLLCMHGSLSLTPLPEHPIGRTVPYFYGALASMAIVAVGTDWIVIDALPRSIGSWRPIFGPGFPVAYLLMAAPIVTILAVWRRLMRTPGRDGERELARIVFYGLSLSVVVGTVTAVVLPMLGVEAVGVTTSAVSFIGVLVAWTLRKYGHSLISPEALSREIFDTLDDGVFVLSKDGLVRDSNRAFASIIGADPADLVGRRITTWLPDFPSSIETFDSPTSIEIWSESGERLPVIISPPLESSARRRLCGHVFLIRDRREVVSLQRRLAVAGRLAAVGDLSRSISESIRDPAVATRVQLQRLGADWEAMLNRLDECGNLEESREVLVEGLELIGECIGGVDRVTAIVEEVGSCSADSPNGGFERHRFSEIVDSAVRIAGVQGKPNVHIETRLDPDIEIACHRSELERVVTNLLVNAIQSLNSADREVGHVTIAVGAQGGRALLHVEDDGCGIAPAVLDRIFDPFFTTKPVGLGTGLGLAISYHIVRKHGGQIRVSSIADRGTSVTVELPRLVEAWEQNPI
jgi:signal transduction histidine kinase